MTIKDCYERFNKGTIAERLVTREGRIESINEGEGFVEIVLSLPHCIRFTTIYVDNMPLLNGLVSECVQKESSWISYSVDMRNVLYMYEVHRGE